MVKRIIKMFKRSRTWTSPGWEILIIAALIIFSISIIYPFWHIIVLSFSTQQYADTAGIKFWPAPVTFNNYKNILKNAIVLNAYRNTILKTLAATSLNVLFTMGLAYGMTKKQLLFYKPITIFIMITLMFSGGMIPSFMLVRWLGIYNTFAAIVFPSLLNAFTIFIARNFLISLPESIEEAALVEGANYMHIFFTIILPLSMPIIATLAIYAAVGNWNSWFDSMIYTKGGSLMTLQLYLRNMMVDMDKLELAAPIIDEGMAISRDAFKACAVVITTLPIIIVYPFVQKYFVKGMLVGAVKG